MHTISGRLGTAQSFGSIGAVAGSLSSNPLGTFARPADAHAFPRGLVHNVAVNLSSDENPPPGSNFRDLLVVLAGLPGTGKTTIGSLLARRLRAVYLRTDVIAGPMLLEGLTEDNAEAGRVAYSIAREVATENLCAGVLVVVDGVHATHERRALWRGVAEATQARLVQLEMALADEAEHRLPVEHRQADALGNELFRPIGDACGLPLGGLYGSWVREGWMCMAALAVVLAVGSPFGIVYSVQRGRRGLAAVLAVLTLCLAPIPAAIMVERSSSSVGCHPL